MNITTKEVEAAVVKISKEDKTNAKILTVNEYGNNSNETSIAQKDVCAKVIDSGTTKVYQVKVNRDGKLYNPLEKNNQYGLDKLDKTTKMPLFKLVNTSEACFANYVSFLRTRHDSFLHIAEREL